MGIVQIAGLALLCVTLILCLKELRATLALPTRLAATLLLLFAALCLLLGGCSSGTETVSAPELLEPAGVELDFAAA